MHERNALNLKMISMGWLLVSWPLNLAGMQASSARRKGSAIAGDISVVL